MPRRTATRTALVTLGLLTLAACVVNLSFAMDKPGVVLQSNSGAMTLSQQAVAVNLGDYKEITDHKANIKSFDLDSLTVTVTAVDPSTTATMVSGTVSLRKNLGDPAANDIQVGTFTNVPIAVGQTVTIKGTPTLDAFLLQQLQTASGFYVVVSGSIDKGVVNTTVDLNLHASIGYDAGIL